MPRGLVAITSGAGGLLSPRLDARADLAKYQIGFRRLENTLILPEGGWTKRPGTRLVAETKDSAVSGTIVPFVYSTVQAYTLQVGQNVLRVHMDKGTVQVAAVGCSITGDSANFATSLGSWSGAAASTPAQVTWDAGLQAMKLAGLAGGDRARLWLTTTSVGAEHVFRFRIIKWQYGPAQPEVVVSGVTGIGAELARFHEAGWYAIPFTPTASPFELEIACGLDIWVDDCSIHPAGAFELATPWTAAQARALKTCQSRDTVYFWHRDMAPHKLERFGHTAWRLKRVIWKDGPYLPVNVTSATITPSAGTGVTTLTLSSATPVNGGKGFQQTDIGRPVRIKKSGGQWGWCIITAVTDATHCTAFVAEAGSGDIGTVAVKDWRLGRWHDGAGWPAHGAFHADRLGATGPRDGAQRIVASKIGDFESFAPQAYDGTVADDNALDLVPSADQANDVRWLASGDVLFAGTPAYEHRVGERGGALSPAEASTRPVGSAGAADAMPLAIGDAVIFIEDGGRAIRELGFTFETDGYREQNILRYAEQLGDISPIEQIVLQRRPWPRLWARRADGRLLSCAYNRADEMLAWEEHPMPNAVVEALAVIPGEAAREDLWLVVRRPTSLLVSEKRFVEVMEPDFREARGDQVEDAWYVDCGQEYSGAPTTTVSGLPWATQAVAVLGDGVDLGDITVVSGTLTLPHACSRVIAGKRIVSVAQPMRFDRAAEGQVMLGELQKLGPLTFSFLETNAGEAGRDEDHLDPVAFRRQDGPGPVDLAGAVPLQSGFITHPFEGRWGPDASLLWRHDAPLPFTIRGVSGVLDVSPR